jgi:hypothetical protein
MAFLRSILTLNMGQDEEGKLKNFVFVNHRAYAWVVSFLAASTRKKMGLYSFYVNDLRLRSKTRRKV